MIDMKQVIIGCVNKDVHSQNELYKWLFPRLKKISLTYSDDDDLLQESFIKIFNKIHTIKIYEEAIIYSWSKRVLINTILDGYKKNKFEKENVKSIDCLNRINYLYQDMDMVLDNYFDITDVVETSRFHTNYLESKGITIGQINSAIDKLSPKYKSVFTLYILDGLKHKEISRELNISVGTSKSNLYKAKSVLSKLLSNG